MGKIKAYVPRSRTGCLTCKKRRVKCDETHPKCLKCSKLKLPCLYQRILFWEDEAHARGVTFGRSASARRQRQQKSTLALGSFQVLKEEVKIIDRISTKRSHYIFINTTYKDFNKQHTISKASKPSTVSGNCGSSCPNIWNSDEIDQFNLNNISNDDIFLQTVAPQEPLISVSPLSPLNDFPLDNPMTTLERQLLNYFIESICPYCVCYPKSSLKFSNVFSTESNPYLNLVAPLAFKSPLVLKVITAASAKQLVLLGQTSYNKIAKKYSYEVLVDLPNIIKERQKMSAKNWDDILTTVIMLCFIEISVNCNSSWLVHLNGAKQFLKESCIRNNVTPIGKFFIRYFISHEVMGETAWVDDNLQKLRPISDDPYIETLKQDMDNNIDLVLGASPYLIALIHKTSELGKCFEHLEHESRRNRLEFEREILSQADKLENELIHLRQDLPSMAEYCDPDAGKHIQTIAEIKRLAALIYLFARIHLEYNYYHGKNQLTDMKLSLCQNYADKIISLHKTLPETYVSLLWPIFILGIARVTESNRWWVLQTLTEMEGHRGLKSVKNAKEIIISVWKEIDLEECPIRWKGMIRGKANTISLA